MDFIHTQEDVIAASLEYFGGNELAAKVFANKYALAKVVDGKRLFAELTPDDMHRRMAAEFARIEATFDNDDVQNWGWKDLTETFYEAMKDFKYIVPQGSVMFGCGNRTVDVSLSNCVVVESPEDSWEGIQKTATEIGNLFKRRAGVGIDISTLRPEGMRVNNAAITTTGAWSFAEHYSNVTRLIGQNGRRGALMLTIDVRHPDVEQFAKMKRDKTKVTGANVSILVSDDFMKAVENDAVWVTQWPVDSDKPTFVKEYRARDLWHTINESAWLRAEPGLIFVDNYRKNLPAHFYEGFEFLTVNPCSEIGLSAYDSCRLVSMNLKGFVENPYTSDAYFDSIKFAAMVRLATRMADNLVELEIEALNKIIDKCDSPVDRELWTRLRDAGLKGRRVGIGTHGLADVFLALGMGYGTPASFDIAEIIYSTLRDVAYDESVELAAVRGPFPAWDGGYNEKGCEFIQRLPLYFRTKMERYGRRNVALLTNAPTGTVSLVSKTSSGIEPVFEFYHTRKKKIEAHDETARVDSVDTQGDRWQHFDVFHEAAKEYVIATYGSVEAWKDAGSPLPEFFVSAPNVDISARVAIQGVIQQYIDHGISSTINLPKDTTIETIEKIYTEAWTQGLKGVTVYRDGCRDGVLVTETSGSEIGTSNAPKRPKELPCTIHRATLKSNSGDTPSEWVFVIGMLNGAPYEVFGGPADAIDLPKGVTVGVVKKTRGATVSAPTGRKTRYDLYVDGERSVCDLAGVFSPEDEDYGLMTRLVSQELRHGIPVEFIVDQLTKSNRAALNSFSKVMARVLKKHVKANAKSGENCAECSGKLVFSEGCQSCPTCGASKCS